MRLLPFAAVLLVAVSSAMAAVAAPYTKAMCMTLSEAGLVNLGAFGCPAHHIPEDPTRVGQKEKVCHALRQGGLVNLEQVGCQPEVRKRERDDRNTGHLKKPSHKGGKRSNLYHHHYNATVKAHHNCHHHKGSKPKHDDKQPFHPKKEHPEAPVNDPKEPTEEPTEEPKPDEPTPDEPESPKCQSEAICDIFQSGMINISVMGCTANEKRSVTILRRDDPECVKKTCKIMQSGGLGNLNLLGCT